MVYENGLIFIRVSRVMFMKYYKPLLLHFQIIYSILYAAHFKNGIFFSNIKSDKTNKK